MTHEGNDTGRILLKDDNLLDGRVLTLLQRQLQSIVTIAGVVGVVASSTDHNDGV